MSWVSVEERLPERKPYSIGRVEYLQDATVLVTTGRVHVTIAYFGVCSDLSPATSEPYFYKYAGRYERVPLVTHWQPLPEPPNV